MTRIRLLSFGLFLFWFSTTFLFYWISMFIEFNYFFLKTILSVRDKVDSSSRWSLVWRCSLPISKSAVDPNIKWGASSRWSFCPNSAWSSTETTIGSTHPTLSIYLFLSPFSSLLFRLIIFPFRI